MKSTDRDQQAAAFAARKKAILAAMPHVLLAVSLLITVAVGPAGGSLAIDGCLAAVASASIVWFVWLHPEWMERPLWAGLFFAGMAVLCAVLVIRAPWFGLFAWSGYLFSGSVLHGRSRIAGLGATALLLGTSQTGGLPAGSTSSWFGWGAIVAVNMLLASAMVWIGTMDELQEHRKERALEDATDSNQRLRAALEENAGLHRQLVAQAREAGIIDERQRMAREIHDTLAQGLTGIITQLAAAGQAAVGSAEHERRVRTAAELARDSLREARRSVAALTPEALRDARLPEALGDVAGRWTELHGVPVEVLTTGEAEPMHPDIDVALLRTAQEALANVAKHASASRVGLTLSYMGDFVRLDVRDDGRGFDPGELHKRPGERGGFGLRGMRQRAVSLGGTLEIESEPGSGTAICASVPALPPGDERQPAGPDDASGPGDALGSGDALGGAAAREAIAVRGAGTR
jgi:signal transduction histidine kinase